MFKVDPLRLFEYSSWLLVWVYLPCFSMTQYLPSLSGITITWHSPYVRFFLELPANNYFMLKCDEKIEKNDFRYDEKSAATWVQEFSGPVLSTTATKKSIVSYFQTIENVSFTNWNYIFKILIKTGSMGTFKCCDEICDKHLYDINIHILKACENLWIL